MPLSVETGGGFKGAQEDSVQGNQRKPTGWRELYFIPIR